MRILPPNNPWIDRVTDLAADWRFVHLSRGWKPGLSWLGRQLAMLPYRQLRFFVLSRSLAEPMPEPAQKIALKVRPFAPGDLEWVRREIFPSEARLFQRRLERGHMGFVACHGERIVGYSWACTDTTLERLELRLEPGDVLFTDSFTVPAFRGRGVQTMLSLERLCAFRERGYARAILYIEVHNTPSLAVWRKLEAQVLARVRFRRVGCWRSTQHDP
ncbi:MAG: GNAT family N-acetyltransferase [bacterium]